MPLQAFVISPQGADSNQNVTPLLMPQSPQAVPSPSPDASKVKDAEGVDGEVNEFMED